MGRKFYFDLTNGRELIRDDEGVEATGLDEAVKEARAALDELRGGHQTGMPGIGWQLIVRDEEGATLATLPLGNGASH